MTRNLVICLDGTWNEPDQMDRDRVAPTNVVKFSRAISPKTADGTRQKSYYDRGVGASGTWWTRIKEGAVGIGLSEMVQRAYQWLGDNFQPGDRIFIVGFSRGAFAARSLSGLIGLCGIPDSSRKPVKEAVEGAYQAYRIENEDDRKEKGRSHAKEYSHRNKTSGNGKSSEILNEIWFVGVWDTVGALGVPETTINQMRQVMKQTQFHDVGLGSNIRHAYHAIAIDEQRIPFKPSLWRAEKQGQDQTVEQVWFPGVHSNVGGGYVDAGLSDRTLLWMCLKAWQAGLAFEKAYMKRRLDPSYHGELRDSMTKGWRLVHKARWFWKNGVREMGVLDHSAGGPAKLMHAGEAIHYTADRRFNHETEVSYKERAVNLAGVLDRKRIGGPTPPILPALPEETDFHAGHEVDWEDPPPFPSGNNTGPVSFRSSGPGHTPTHHPGQDGPDPDAPTP